MSRKQASSVCPAKEQALDSSKRPLKENELQIVSEIAHFLIM